MQQTTEDLIIQAQKDNLRCFVSDILGWNNADFHDELDDVLSNPVYKKVVITMPRGHGKSNQISIAYPLWEIARNHNVRILLVSSTQAIATTFVSQILNHVEANELYQKFSEVINDAGVGVKPKKRKLEKKDEKWSSSSITIDRPDLNLKDPTIQALGLFGSILSRRADIIIVDDLVNQQNSATDEQRKKIKDWVYTTLLPCLVPGGRFIYLGNTWHVDDLVANLFSDPQFDYKKRNQAIISESKNMQLWYDWAKIRMNEEMEHPARLKAAQDFYSENKAQMDDGVQILWKEMFNYGDLILERIANPYAFARMRQCDPRSRPDQKIREEWLEEAIRKGRGLRLQDAPREGLVINMSAAGLDLAIGEEEINDDNSLCILDRVRYGSGETIKAGDFVLRQLYSGKWTPKETREKVKLTYITAKYSSVRVESNGYQMAISRDLAEDSDITVPVTSYQTGGEKNDSDIGIASIATLLEMGKVVIPWDMSDPRTIEEVSKLLNDLREYPIGHTGDRLMSLWFAYSEIRDALGDRYTVPTIMGKEIQKETVNVFDEQERKKAEEKVDKAKQMESEYERRLLWGR